MRRPRPRHWPHHRGRAVLLGIGLLLAACQATPSPSSSARASTSGFVSASYPVGAPADCSYGGEMAQIRAVDQLTVEFSLCYADPAFLSRIAMANNAIQDGAWLAKYGPTGQLGTVENGTGPYRIGEGNLSSPDLVSLGRFDGYWGDKAKTAGVTIAGQSDAEARLQALHLGSIDGIDDPSAADLGTIAADSTLHLLPRELLNTTYIGMNSDFAPFDSVKVRRAVAMGIDRQQIVLNALPPGSSLAPFLTPCSIEFGCDGDPWYQLDRAGAMALLADVGFPGPLTTHIYYREGAACSGADPSLVAKELQGQLQEALGISADLRPLDPLTFADKLSAGLFDGIYVADWCAAFPDVSDASNRLFDDPANRQFGTIDRSITDALTRGSTTADPAARKAAYAAANSAIRAAVPMIPLAHGGSATAWKADVTGAVASPLDAESFAALDPRGRGTISWMQATSPRSFYCADAPDGDSVRLCANVFEQLYAFKPGTATVVPALATSCDANAELTIWTCHLRSGVTFHDGASLDATDVLQSFAAQWDYTHPVHRGGLAQFAGWTAEFGPFLNAPPAS